jgi:hypothetical protein
MYHGNTLAPKHVNDAVMTVVHGFHQGESVLAAKMATSLRVEI